MVELLVSSNGPAAPALIVRKHVEDPLRLAHQVRWLTRAQGRGVVRLHEVRLDDGLYATVFGGPRTLATAATDPASALPILGDTWTALERLHRLGLAHGAVAAEHVVVGSNGALLLSPGGPDGVDRQLDLAGFGTMVTGLAEVWEAEQAADPPVVDCWRTVGRRISDLGASPSTGDDDRVITGSEIRRLLAQLPPGGRSGRGRAAWRFRRRRRCAPDRDRRAGRRPSRS